MHKESIACRVTYVEDIEGEFLYPWNDVSKSINKVQLDVLLGCCWLCCGFDQLTNDMSASRGLQNR
jgi:hypothetical protein